MMRNRVFLGLVHYPVYNKNGEKLASSVSNLDIHDIARAAATYDAETYFMIHPHPGQQKLIGELSAFWREGYGARYNPDRKEALARLAVSESADKAAEEIEARYGGPVIRVVTDARSYPRSISYRRMREKMETGSGNNFLLLFGTGYGLAEEIMETADYVLAPVTGRGDYNHLSVRSAAAIILDRLLSPAWWDG